MLLSLLAKNLPSIFTARTLSELSALISMMVSTVSYKIALPTFFAESVLVATLKRGVSIGGYWPLESVT